MFKVKIITLFNGERSLKLLKTRLKKQKKIIFEHKIISGLNIEESNAEFYREFQRTEDDYDYVIKMDADMLPKDEYSIFQSLQIAKSINKKRLTLSILDFHSKLIIFGIHILLNESKNQKFNLSEIPISDKWIISIPGKSIISNKNIIFYHGILPNEEQLLHFGYQRGRKLINAAYSHNHWIIAERILKNLKRSPTKKNKILASGLLIGLEYFKDTNHVIRKSVYFKKLSTKILRNITNGKLDNELSSSFDNFLKLPGCKNFFNKVQFLFIFNLEKLKRGINLLKGNHEFSKNLLKDNKT